MCLTPKHHGKSNIEDFFKQNYAIRTHKAMNQFDLVIHEILAGHTILIIEGYSQLITETIVFGNESHTHEVSLMYVKNIANPELVENVKNASLK